MKQRNKDNFRMRNTFLTLTPANWIVVGYIVALALFAWISDHLYVGWL